MAKPVNNITFHANREVDKALIKKINAVAPHYYDDPTGTARRLLHQKLDEVIKNLGLKISDFPAQSARAG